MCGETLIIGANINYHEYVSESGGTVSASYTSTKTTRGSTNSSDSDATYSIVNNSGIQWIVLGEENGQIKITTKNIVQPTSGGYTDTFNYGNFKLLNLRGETGYTNFIDELNKISAIYGKGRYADTTKFSSSGGRSFSLKDLGYEELSSGQYRGTQTLSTEVSKADMSYWLASRYRDYDGATYNSDAFFVTPNGIKGYYRLLTWEDANNNEAGEGSSRRSSSSLSKIWYSIII